LINTTLIIHSGDTLGRFSSI